MAKRPQVSAVTPPATAAYAWLQKPDEGQEYSDGKYKVTILLPKDDKSTVDFITKMTPLVEDLAIKEFGKLPSGFKYPWKDGDDTSKDEFKDHWMMVAKSKYLPGYVDVSKKPVAIEDAPMSGDLVRLATVFGAYSAGGAKGVSAQLRNVMLVERRNKSGDAFAEIEAAESADAEDDFDI
jgi:hypothetical protein|tara:strand:+ start:567 stop:1106 length:540 start_codon:yes stop_codon:yes gene_type:complete